MKFLVQVIITVAICFLLQFFLPWWTLAIGTFIVAFLFNEKSFLSFAVGFISVAVLWQLMALYSSLSTDFILTTKLNQLLPINSFIVTSVVGGLVGGFGALTGSLFRKL